MSDTIFLAREALKKLFKPDGHFSICDFDNITKALGIVVPGATRDKLALLHCINWCDMEPETRKWVANTVDSLMTNPDNLAANFLPRVLGGRPMAISDAVRALSEVDG